MVILTKQISICFNSQNQYVDSTGSGQTGLAYIQVPFTVKSITIKEIASDFGSDSEYFSLINSDLLGNDSCLGIIYMGNTSLIKDYSVLKNNRFSFQDPKSVMGTYTFQLRNSQLTNFNQPAITVTGEVVNNTDLLVVSAGTPPPVSGIPLSTAGALITPALWVTSQSATAGTFTLNRKVTPAYAAGTVFSYPALSGAIQVVMEFNSE